MDNKIAKDNKAALLFGCRSPELGRLFGNDIISNAEADKICMCKYINGRRNGNKRENRNEKWSLLVILVTKWEQY